MKVYILSKKEISGVRGKVEDILSERESGDSGNGWVCDFEIETRVTVEFLIPAAATIAEGERLFPDYKK